MYVCFVMDCTNPNSYLFGVPNVLDVEQVFPPDSRTVVNVRDMIHHERTVAKEMKQVCVNHQQDHVHRCQSVNRFV